VFYVYYGNSSATDGANSTDVWDSHYKGVWHLNETGTDTRKDSTSNGNNGTASGGVAGTAGKIGGANSFDGSDDYIDLGSNEKDSPLAIQDKGTWSVWFYNREDKHASILAQRYDKPYHGRGVGIGSTSIVRFWTRDSDTNWEEVNTQYNLNQWYYIVGIQNGNIIKLYLNG